MQTGIISFCNDSALNIKSTVVKTDILNELNNKYNIKIIQKHFESFDVVRSIPKLKNNPYMICLKSNGNPYYMYLTKYNNVNVTIMIDKKIHQGYFLPRMIIVRTGFDDELFTNTLFDGEMIKTFDNEWIYTINDLLVLKNEKLDSMNVLKRINNVYTILASSFRCFPNDIFSIQVKKYVKCSEIETILLPFMKSLKNTSRGLLFKPMFSKFKDILLNFDDSLIDNSKKVKYTNMKDNIYLDKSVIDAQFDIPSIKSSDTHNICVTTNTGPSMYKSIHKDREFYVKNTELPDTFELYDEKKELYGIACVPTLQASQYLNTMFKDTMLNEMKKIVFVYNNNFKNKWVPKLN